MREAPKRRAQMKPDCLLPRAEPDQSDRASSAGLGASLLVGVVALGLFAPTVWFDFTNWDDPQNILQNPYLNPVTAQGLAELWKKPFNDLYVPLTYTSFALDMVIWKGRPGGFHLTNVLLHALSAVLVHRLLRRLLAGEVAAVLGALLFVVHPLQVEAVCWATGRKDTLSGLFSVLALLLYAQWAQRRRPVAYVIGLLALLLALLAKPSAVAVPLMVLVIGWFCVKGSWRRVILSVLPWFLIAGAWTVVTMRAQPPGEYSFAPPPVWQRFFVASDAIAFYLGKLFMPVGLVAGYERSPMNVLSSPWVYVTPLVPVALALLALRASALLRAAGGLMLAGIIPVLGIIPFRYQDYSTVADRYFYLSMVGVALACGTFYHSCETFASRLCRPWLRRLACGSVLAVLSVLTLFQQRVWQNGLMLWTHNVELVSHCAVAHFNLADELRKEDLERAAYHYGQAVHYHENYHQARINLANSLFELAGRDFEQGRDGPAKERLAEAIHHYDFMLERKPNKSPYYFMAGRAYDLAGDSARAEELFLEALRYPPPLADAHAYLADLLARRRDFAGAIEHCQEALRIDPTNAPAAQVLGAIRRPQ